MATADQTKQQIIDRVAAYNAEIRRIREDLTLSPLGRRRALETLYDSAKAAVDQLRATLERDTHGDRRTLERRLFGLPTNASGADAISHRDALDRVTHCRRPEEVAQLMERAAGTGDTMLLRAGFAHAWRKSREPMSSDLWDNIVTEYLDQNPGAHRDAEALANMATSRGATAKFGERLSMTVSRPRELDQREDALSDQPPVPSRAGSWGGSAA